MLEEWSVKQFLRPFHHFFCLEIHNSARINLRACADLPSPDITQVLTVPP